MALRPILKYPDPHLKQVAAPVKEVTDEIRQLVDDMAETMYAAPGVGLAANQVGVLLRVFVIDIANDDEPSDLRVFINPEITSTVGTQTWEEGCLSFPGVTEEIRRAEQVTVRALDRDGKPFTLEADGLLAVAVQHENDHLNGVVMLDKLNAVKRRLLGRKLAQAKSAEASADV
ncbi:MAG TPA: peptide deformylase [Polyangiaceae bacterium]|jgi:peptide deformylase|nr:peptide deformylase [Polyangiaceae bacterium]